MTRPSGQKQTKTAQKHAIKMQSTFEMLISMRKKEICEMLAFMHFQSLWSHALYKGLLPTCSSTSINI